MDLYFDRKGQPIGMWDWAKRVEQKQYRQVKLTRMGDCYVSTIWFGLRSFEMPPMIFETAVFGPGTPHSLTDRLIRYPTEREARYGHKAIRAFVVAARRMPVNGREYTRRRKARR